MTNATTYSCNPAAQGMEVLMSVSVSLLEPLAARMAIPARALVALPVAVEVFARKANMTIEQMVTECLQNAALREYLAEICIKGEAAL